MAVRLLVVLTVVITMVCFAKPALEDHPRHKIKDDLHFKDEKFDSEKDHDAFLGDDEAEDFNNLDSTEGRIRLRRLVEQRIDTNGDGFVTREELIQWLTVAKKEFVERDVRDEWANHNEDNDSVNLSWSTYHNSIYGDEGTEDEEPDDDLKADKFRWAKADKDEDGDLSYEEFRDFLHPETVERMRPVIIQEALAGIDENKDGKLSLSEYLADVVPGSVEGENDYDREAEVFREERDKDKNGFLDGAELNEWIMPHDYDDKEAEASHLISEADDDGDGKMSIEEIVSNFQLFIGSFVTDYGTLLHEEL